MKYPQLVSTRAVNAISDWLVSRLEQLGVEAPLIYSRLLLSLLHTSVQINDPIEFSNLESYLANRKGNKRILPSDSETLKKFTAVQCLTEAVSSEQEITKIKCLIDELCEKLSDLEKQGNTEENFDHTPPTLKNLDIEDPRKRYYRAFPALSKEMEDSVWLSKRNSDTLTWPTGNNVTASSSSMRALSSTAGVKRKPKRRRNQAMSKGKSATLLKNCSEGSGSPTWDTDFEGSWEMGRDLIKEFLTKENNRNRSTSESDACNVRNYDNNLKSTETSNADEYFSLPQNIADFANESNADTSLDDELPSISSDVMLNEFCPTPSISIQEDTGYSTHNNKGLNSLSEIDGPMSSSNISGGAPRRLYERDVSNDSLNLVSSEQNDFALFEAKFNSSVEALWKDNSESNLPKAANHQNLENFWTNYYNHHYDIAKCEQEKTVEDHDYFSMPTNLDDPVVRSKTRKLTAATSAGGGGGGGAGAGAGNNYVLPGGSLISSIWSENPPITNYENDDSFYANVLRTSYKNNKKHDVKDSQYTYNISKWSECSFEPPFIPSTTNQSNETAANKGINKSDLRENMLKNSYLYSYKNSLASSANNTTVANPIKISNHHETAPMSLPDFFGSFDVVDSGGVDKSVETNIVGIESNITTLKNHSKSSRFINFASIKFSQPPKQTLSDDSKMISQSSSTTSSSIIPNIEPLSSSSNVSGEDDEEENLLTSEKTHFRPIKQSYADGHQFEISNNYDEIEFQRDSNGYLLYESERYLEVKNRVLIEDDYGNMKSHKNSSADSSSSFTLKFRVSDNDKQCQTDDLFESTNYIVDIHRRSVVHIGNNNKNNKSDYEEDCIVDMGNVHYLKDETSINIEHWSMEEISRKCQDNNNSHSLWGMCLSCNNKENISVPANRLLKDDVNTDADQLLSDLNYMQHLYITSDWEDDEEVETDDDNVDDNDEIDNGINNIKNFDQDDEMAEYCKCFIPMEHSSITIDDEDPEPVFYNVTKLISDLIKPENAKSLANALNTNNGKNLLKQIYADDNQQQPQQNSNNNNNNNLKTIGNNETIILKNFNNNNNNEKYIGGLWNTDENIIWQKPINNNCDPSIWAATCVNDNPNTKSPSSKFLEKLNWEYSNLAEIWDRTGEVVGNCGVVSEASTLEDNIIQHIDPAEYNCCNNIKNLKNLVAWNEISQKNQGSFMLYENNDIIDNRNRIRFDRKRRHSASQNVNCMAGSVNDFYENAIYGNKIEIMANRDLDYGNLTSINGATIITCKYWTTFGNDSATSPLTFFINSSGKASTQNDGTGTAVTINPSSILKHVTVVTRPLTR